MDFPKRITFIDAQDKKYVLPVKLIIAKHYLRSFLQHAPPREKDSTPEDVIFKFLDLPDAVEIMVHVLQHGNFSYPRHWQVNEVVLQNLLEVVRVGEKYHVRHMARRAESIFENHIKHYADIEFPDEVYYADFATTVERLYAPALPQEGLKTTTTTPGQPSFSSKRAAPSEDSVIPLLKRHVVDHAAQNYRMLAINSDCYRIFDPDAPAFNGGPNLFIGGVARVKKRHEARAKLKEKGLEYPYDEWSDLFAAERYVTLVDRNGKKHILTRKDVLEQSQFLHGRAPKPDNLTFTNATYILAAPHPYGLRAIADIITDGPRHFDVPATIAAADLAIEYLAHTLTTGEQYGVFSAREAVKSLLLGRRGTDDDYLARCRKPYAITNAVKAVYALKQCGEDGGVLGELKGRFVEWAVERSQEAWKEGAVKRIGRKVSGVGEDVLRAEEEKMRRAAEEDGEGDEDVVSGGAGEDMDSGSEEDSDSSAEEDSDSSAEEDSDSSSE